MSSPYFVFQSKHRNKYSHLLIFKFLENNKGLIIFKYLNNIKKI